MGHLAGSQRDSESPSRWRFRPRLPPSGVVETLKNRIIPKIALVFRSPNPPQPAPVARFNGTDIQTFVDQLVNDDESDAFAYIEALLGDGVSADTIYSELLTPTAGLLREKWEIDSTDFAHITLGLRRIQQIAVKLGNHAPKTSVGLGARR